MRGSERKQQCSSTNEEKISKINLENFLLDVQVFFLKKVLKENLLTSFLS